MEIYKENENAADDVVVLLVVKTVILPDGQTDIKTKCYKE